MITDWTALQLHFSKEHSATGISVKAWCEKEVINYATARRHIKLNPTNASASMRKCSTDESVKTTQKTSTSKSNKHNNQSVNVDDIYKNTSKEVDKTPPQKKRSASLANQNARTFGHYSEFITTDEDADRYVSAATTKLDAELNLTRMQLSNVMVAIKIIETDLDSDLTIEQKIKLHESYEKYQTVASVKVARIESLESSIIRNEKMRVDIQKTIVLTEKAQLEADKLKSEVNNELSPLRALYEEIIAMDSDGMMNIE